MSFKQALRWENGTVWRKSSELPQPLGIALGETSVVVMTFKSVSIKKQLETGIENLEEGREKLQLVEEY